MNVHHRASHDPVQSSLNLFETTSLYWICGSDDHG
jgi:hypothetical protein